MSLRWSEEEYQAYLKGRGDEPHPSALLNGAELASIGNVWGWNQQLMALEDPLGQLLYIRQDALDALPGDRFIFTMRYAMGRPFVAAHHGIMCEAMISPIDPEDAQKLNQAMRIIATKHVWNPNGGVRSEAVSVN